MTVPDLYLAFASEIATPDRIRHYASRFGLLRFPRSIMSVPRVVASELEHGFKWISGTHPESLVFNAERASDWLREFEVARQRLSFWSDIKRRNDPEEMRLFLEDTESYFVGGQARFTLRFDMSTGDISSEMVALSLADMLRIQFADSIAAKVLHRQCRECARWFSVHASSGRPEKEFCSNACRMRAYRRRQKQSDRTSAQGR